MSISWLSKDGDKTVIHERPKYASVTHTLGVKYRCQWRILKKLRRDAYFGAKYAPVTHTSGVHVLPSCHRVLTIMKVTSRCWIKTGASVLIEDYYHSKQKALKYHMNWIKKKTHHPTSSTFIKPSYPQKWCQHSLWVWRRQPLDPYTLPANFLRGWWNMAPTLINLCASVVLCERLLLCLCPLGHDAYFGKKCPKDASLTHTLGARSMRQWRILRAKYRCQWRILKD